MQFRQSEFTDWLMIENVISSGVRLPPEPPPRLAFVLTVTVTAALLGDRFTTFAGATSLFVNKLPAAHSGPENTASGGLALFPVEEEYEVVYRPVTPEETCAKPCVTERREPEVQPDG